MNFVYRMYGMYGYVRTLLSRNNPMLNIVVNGEWQQKAADRIIGIPKTPFIRNNVDAK